MDWITKMNDAIDYIEAHLMDGIDLEAVAKLAGCSAYHFQRVFSYMAGTTLPEYIRRRRLTLAAFELQNSEDKVIDVAMKFGYDSPTAFTRAFGQFHGMTPSEAKNSSKMFTAYPPISFQITIRGVAKLNYRIEELDAFRTVGVKLETTWENEVSLQDVPKFWGETAQSGKIPQILSLMNKEPFGLLGISGSGSWEEANEFDYYISVSTNKDAPVGMVEYDVPASKWAVFQGAGLMPHAMQELQKRIVTEWLPTSGYEYGKAPDIEVYGDGDQSSPDYKFWVWLPIVRK